MGRRAPPPRQTRLEPRPGPLVVALEMGQQPGAHHRSGAGHPARPHPGPRSPAPARTGPRRGPADVPEPGQRPGQSRSDAASPLSSSQARAARRLARSASRRSARAPVRPAAETRARPVRRVEEIVGVARRAAASSPAAANRSSPYSWIVASMPKRASSPSPSSRRSKLLSTRDVRRSRTEGSGGR